MKLRQETRWVPLMVVLAMIIPTAAMAKPPSTPAGGDAVEITLLHTNDFHGRLETDYRYRGGSAYLSDAINDIRDEVGADNVALLDAGDVYFAAPAISQLLMGESTIDVYNMMGYDVATFGNHEFDKGQDELALRIAQSNFPWLGANVVMDGTDWTLPDWAKAYEILEVGGIKLGVLGLAGEETPEVTLLGTTAGLTFKDLTETVVHYYDEVMAQADAMVVLVHMGSTDSGPFDGLMTVAQSLIDLEMPVDLMIGGHQHEAIDEPIMVGDTAIVAAGYYGRWLGRIDVAIDPATKSLSIVDRELITITGGPTPDGLLGALTEKFDEGLIDSQGTYQSLLKKLENAMQSLDKGQIKAASGKLEAFANEIEALTGKNVDPEAASELIAGALSLANDVDLDVAERVSYWSEIVAPIVTEPVAQTNISLTRDYNDESLIGDIVTDSMLWSADLYDDGELNSTVDAAFTNPGGLRADIVIPDGASLPHTVTWGDTFEVLPFGNTLYIMDLTGAQIQDLLDQSAKLYKGILQTAGASYSWHNDTGTDTATSWGAYGVEIGGEPLDRGEVYTIVTNDFLAGGQDGWTTFADGANRWNTYYDMQEGLVEYVKMLDVIDAEDVPGDRIVQLDNVVTMLHTNDTHGRWEADFYGGGFAYLADLIAKERAHNPNALLLDAGDTFQGNSFAYFFKDRADNPIAGGMNLLGYDAMTVGNHEFNFGPTTFDTMLGLLEFPILGAANLDDDGSYGFINDNIDDYTTTNVDGIEVAIFGLTNPRVYRYELPTNIPGLTFYPTDQTNPDAIDIPGMIEDIELAEAPDLIVGLTHVGYSPYGDEVDSDLILAEQVAGADVLIGGHSHSTLNPAVLVSSTANPEGTLIAQARRYAGYLGQVNVGFVDGEIVLREGFLIPTSETTPDADLLAYLAPFTAEIAAYNDTVIGSTEVPIDALAAYTEETNGANLQADAAVHELATAGGITVDVHLSGAMSNRKVADSATPALPLPITKGNMFDLMPYENSLVVLEMDRPQIKEVLERSYRNWWWYNQGSPYGNYSHYTTCMLTTDSGNVITYTGDLSIEPDGNNVLALELEGVPVDFSDATTTYLVSTVNYVAAGSCNFNNAGETIWPLDQIAYDTQYYVRDTVINYVEAQVLPIAPAIEGRLVFPTP